MTILDERETRAEVCEECEHLLRAMPLTCALVKRQKQIGLLPCPHALRAMLYDVEAVCPHPDEAWATRWRMADLLPMPAETAGASATSATLDGSVTPDAGAASDASVDASAQATGSTCAAKTANREINPEAIERRGRERQSRRRGVSHEAFYVQAHPARPVADP